jgi:hypothetical protein
VVKSDRYLALDLENKASEKKQENKETTHVDGFIRIDHPRELATLMLLPLCFRHSEKK